MHVTRMMQITGMSALLVGLLFGSQAALAHHSFAMFDRDKNTTVAGTVKEVDYANPHVWVIISVMNSQRQEETWGLEGGNLQGLYRMGWQKDTVKPGDKVTVRIHPRKDGDHGGQIMNLTQADGRVLGPRGAAE